MVSKIFSKRIRYFFTGDEHLDHSNVIKYCNRPFDSIEEMTEIIIRNFNEVVTPRDITVHVGDFALSGKKTVLNYIKRLNGNHIFIRGNHDRWMDRTYHEMWVKTIESQTVVACHYALRVWPQSHYGSWQVYGHSHGKLPPVGLQYDVGVDNNDFYPVSFEQLKEIFG